MKKEIIKIIRPYWYKYAVALLVGLLLNFMLIIASFISKVMIDTVIPSHNIVFLYYFVIGYILFFALNGAISFCKEMLFSKLGYLVLKEVRGIVHAKIINVCKMECFSTEKQGYIITLFKDWLNSISWFLSNVLLNTVTDLIFLVLVLIIIAKENLFILFVVAITLPVFAVIYVIFNKRVRDTRMQMMEEDSEVTQELKISLDGIKEIRSFNVRRMFINRYDISQDKFVKSGCKYVYTSAAYDVLSNLICVLGQCIVLFFGIKLVFSGKMSTGTLIAINSLTAMLYKPIEKIVNFNRLYQVFKVEYTKLENFIKDNISEESADEQFPFYGEYEDKREVKLEVRNVSYSYENLEILDNISFSLKEGKNYVLDGKNGSGKTTLIYLLLGLVHPSKGNIIIQGINYADFSSDTTAYFGYVSREPFFMNDSIENNILFGRTIDSRAFFDKIINVCEIDVFMKKNDISLNTCVGEKAEKLSGGERQKVALARALYIKPKILIIDEGMSNLTIEVEARILKKIRELDENLTILLVTHRDTPKSFEAEHLLLEEGKIKYQQYV